VATTATIGEHALIIVDSLANQRFTFLTKRKSFEDKLDMLYFHYYMFIIDEWCKKNTNAGGLLSVNMDSFKKLTIPYPPSLSEQRKIAECFVSLDKQIDSTKEKLKQLKEHKKGLMQRLFPAKGKTTPEFRFPGCCDTKEWDNSSLGAIGDTFGGLSGKSSDDFGSGRPFVTYKQVFDFSEVSIKDCSLVRILESESQNKLEYGDVLVTMSSETPEEIGYTSVVTDKDIPECYLNSFCFIYRIFDKDSFDPRFLIYLFNCDTYRSSVIRIAQGITRYNISKIQFKDIMLSYPKDKSEQRAIAEVLYSADIQINKYVQKVNELEIQKKGLRQQLFPKL
jgi:type I restriction enzyme S subunit